MQGERSGESLKGAGGKMSDAAEETDQEISICIKHAQQSYSVNIGKSSSVKVLMEVIQKATNVHPRGQKLIYKGTVLTPEMTVESAALKNRANVLLIATAGVHQGPAPATSRPAVRPALTRPSAREGAPVEAMPAVTTMEKRRSMWAKTGVVSLQASRCKELPGEVWQVADAVRVLDLGDNDLLTVPPQISLLVNLKRLRLSENKLTDASLPWEALCSLQHLLILALDNNNLTQVPEAIGRLRSLQSLTLSFNALVSVPEGAWADLQSLSKLNLRSNRLSCIPASLGGSRALAELDISANFLKTIPDAFSQLQSLKVLLLDNNAIETVPAGLFRGCSCLFTLSLKGNPITVETLREIDGWEEYEERRRDKYTKQMEFQVMGPSSGFDEGTDKC